MIVPAASGWNLFGASPFNLPRATGESHVQHRLVSRRGRHRDRRSEPGWFRLILNVSIHKEKDMNSIVWLVGAVVIVLAILSFVGLG
jgi:hypothetical protein